MRFLSSCYLLAIFFLFPLATFAQEPEVQTLLYTPPRAISDNSFLLEEAYNQEAGVVQHVNTFEYDPDAGDWIYEFSQEWPLWSQAHQFSFGVPVNRISAGVSQSSGLGDITIDYRFQPGCMANPNFALAPRISVILPTGDATKGLGSGGLGIEAGLPWSVRLSERTFSHTNVGITLYPKTEVEEIEGKALSFGIGQSFVWILHDHLNFLLEGIWEHEIATIGDVTDRESVIIVNPGVRTAIDFENGLQIVPAFSVPITITSDATQTGLFFYLSFEHPF